MKDNDKAKVFGWIDRRVDLWRLRTPTSHVTDQVEARGKPGAVEVVVNDEVVGSEVVKSDIVWSEVVSAVPKVLMDQDQANSVRVDQDLANLVRINHHDLGQAGSLAGLGDSGGPPIGLEKDQVGNLLGGPPGGLVMDPVADMVGQQLGLGHGGMLADEENRFDDPLLCEVNSVFHASLTCSGPGSGLGLTCGSI